jgi:hypothetical protein
MWDMPRDENSLYAHVNPSRGEVEEGDTPIFFTFVDSMRFENKLMHAILVAEIKGEIVRMSSPNSTVNSWTSPIKGCFSYT